MLPLDITLLVRILTFLPALAAEKLLIELVDVDQSATDGALGASEAVAVVELGLEHDAFRCIARFVARSAGGTTTTKAAGDTSRCGCRSRSATSVALIALFHSISTLVPALAAVKLLVVLVHIGQNALDGAVRATHALGVIQLALERNTFRRIAGLVAGRAGVTASSETHGAELA